MVKPHRSFLAAAGSGAKVMLDTPFGFQANADDLTEKIQEYFEQSVGSSIEPAVWRRQDEPVSQRERTLAQLQRASWVFAGPGSPSYALRQWQNTQLPSALAEVVHRGGTLIMGSAAAVTVGAQAIPVYEIYKVGDDPQWLPGLDLLGELTGIAAAVIPHFDNKEGGRHDTRYCYLGAQRLDIMETLLPDDLGIIGVDEHTAAVFDITEQSAEILGAGGLTLRHRGRTHVVPSGDTVAFTEIRAFFTGAPAVGTTQVSQPGLSSQAQSPPTDVPSLRGTATTLKAEFTAALDRGDADAALTACLELEEAIHAWSADTLQGDDVDAARQTLRSMLVDFSTVATKGLTDPRTLLEPVVNVAITLRQRARTDGDYALSDEIRDGLAAAGIEVRDTPEGVTWHLASPDAAS
jgi:cyanophycinase-like exopeptidase